MRKNVTFVAVVLSVILSGIWSCKLVEDSGESSQGVNALRLASGDISSWAEDQSGGFISFTASNMQQLVNGGAPQYVEKGLVAGFEQRMSNGSKAVKLLILDFGTEANAVAMYTKKDSENSDKSDVGTYPQSVAQLDNSAMDGVTAIAHFGKYFMELAFTGYTDKSESRATAKSFVEVFEVNISDLKQ